MLSMLVVLSSLAIPSAVAASGAVAPDAPSFELPTFDGRTVSRDSLRRKVVLLDFWASWCVPCRSSFPWLEAMHRRHAGDGLVVLAVNLDKKRDSAERFLAKYPASFMVAFDPTGKTAEAFRVEAMQSTYILGPNGSILDSRSGFDPKETARIEAEVQEACSKQESE